MENRSDFDAVVSLVYAELKRIARRQIKGRHETLFTTDLVHETYVKLAGHESALGRDRAHFYAIAVRAMRQVLVSHARKRAAQKRGGAGRSLLLTARNIDLQLNLDDMLALDAALDRLDEVNERWRRVVELRFFGGLSEQEVAELLDVSARTVERDWVAARLYLHRELYPEATASAEAPASA